SSLTAVGVASPSWLLVLSLLAGTACAMICSLFPVIAVARVQAHQALTSSGSRTMTGGARAWRSLLVAQISLTVVILIGAGLLLRSAWSTSTWGLIEQECSTPIWRCRARPTRRHPR